MQTWFVAVVKTVIGISLVGSVLVQVGMIVLGWHSLEQSPAWLGVALATIGVLGVGTLQVVGLNIWKLLTMVHSGTVFSQAAFRYVDRVIGAIGAAAMLTFSIAVVGRFANHAVEGDEVAPGMIGLICGLALVVAGVALVVYVMRALLSQAVALDNEASLLKSELEEVI